jgi:hypothetical protein
LAGGDPDATDRRGWLAPISRTLEGVLLQRVARGRFVTMDALLGAAVIGLGGVPIALPSGRRP